MPVDAVAHANDVIVGQVWRTRTGGPFWTKKPIRVMAVAEGYVMARFKGCAPFVRSVADFTSEYERKV